MPFYRGAHPDDRVVAEAMKKPRALGPKSKQWLKGLHITFSVVWLGAAICMNVLRFAWTPTSDGEIYAVNQMVVVLDEWVIIPSALGALATGALESWMTPWGFFRYRWVSIKWIVTVAVMLYAPLFQAQWAKEMAAISKLEGLMALQNPVYVQLWSRYAASGLLMILGLSALPIVSSVKPWMKHDKAHSARLAKAADAQ
jgi:uncharacterized membrane protein